MIAAAPRPLTIVQVATNLDSWGGLEIHLLNLGAQLKKRGHRVIVAGRPGRFVLTRAQALGLETFEATVKRQGDWTDFGRLRDFFRREKVDVTHAHNQDDVLVPAAAARLAGVPVSFVTWHLPIPFHSRASGHFILAVGIVGRVAAEKGHRDLFEALRLLSDRHPRLRVVVVGNGPDLPDLRKDAAGKGLGKRVVFAGFREDVNNAMAALDIVAVPSIWPEPCSAAIQQGMALNKPVVASRVGGTPEVLTDGETGLLVPASDPVALADALGQLADAPDLRRKMGEAGRARVEAHFTLGRMVDEVESLYRRELGQSPR